MRTLTDQEKKVCWAWASWTAENVREALDDHGVVDVQDEGFIEVVTDILNDIAQSNAIGSLPSEGKE